MSKIETNILLEHISGGTLGYYKEKEELFTELSGLKDKSDGGEYINIGDIIFFQNKKLKVQKIDVKLANISREIYHENKPETDVPTDFKVEIGIFVEYMDS
jgi:hypothetical protein